MNQEIKEYKTGKGKKRFKFSIYLGKDENTGRSEYIRKSGFKSLSQAEKKYVELKEQVLNGTYQEKSKKHLKFKEVYEEWASLYAETVKESTYATTVRIIDNHVLPEFGNTYIDKITLHDCQRAVNKWFKVAPKTFKKYIRYSNNVFNYARKLKLIADSPMKDVIRPKIKVVPTENKQPKYYDKNELRIFLDSAKDMGIKPYTFFVILAYYGLRRGEALGLKWSDIDLSNKTLSVNRTLTRGINNRMIIQTPKTDSSIRTLDLDDTTISILKEWKVAQQKEMTVINLNEDLFVFDGTVNGYPANVPMLDTKPDKWNIKICKKAGIRHINIHGFRHTNASLLFDAGVSMQDVKDRLGHSSIRTTMDIYTHIMKSRRRATTKKLVEYMQL